MSAALKPPPAKPTRDFRLSKLPSSSKALCETDVLVLDALRQCEAQGLKARRENLERFLPAMNCHTIRSAYGRLVKRGLAERRESYAPHNRDGPKPCAKCGDPGGYIHPNRKHPARHTVKGWSGMVCQACHRVLTQRPKVARFADDGLTFEQRCVKVRGEREGVMRFVDGHDTTYSSFVEGLAAERAVAAEQAAKLLRIRSETPDARDAARREAFRLGSQRASREYWAAVGRLSGHRAYCVVSFE